MHQNIHLTSPFLVSMRERGLLNQCTDLSGLDARMQEGPITAFVGFDATADSLHAGHLVSLVAMRRLAASGHKVVALMGGATTLVGDPSFRNSARPMLSPEDVASNIRSIRSNIEAVMSGLEARLVFADNAEWLGTAGLIDFMRSVGSHFTVSRMLSMESVKSRLDDGLTALEFTYMMLQAADFLELSRRHGCVLQMGGSDQWGNIVQGVELARRADGRELFGLTTLLLTTSSGAKMGKTANGAVWLSSERLHPSDFWQFWRNVDDADVARFLLLFTDIGPDEVVSLTQDGGQGINAAKRLLADKVTAMVHGQDAAVAARTQADGLFGGTREPDPVSIAVDGEPIGLLTLMTKLGFSNSNNDARRLVEGNAVKIDGKVLSDAKRTFAPGDRAFLLSAGKRRRALVQIVPSRPSEVPSCSG